MRHLFLYFFLLYLMLVSCSSPKHVDLRLSSVGDSMNYDQAILNVKAGSHVTLTFINNATMAGMKHNVVILKPKTNIKKFTAEALAHGPSYVPPSDNIIAQTIMTRPGETVSITFTMPNTKGYYPFVCTFPGHSATMQGVIRVN